MAAKFASEARVVFLGDVELAATFEGKARVLMGEMLEFMDYGDLKYENKTHTLREITHILIGTEVTINEFGRVEIKTFDDGYNTEIRLKANLAGEAPIIEIEIEATKLIGKETTGAKFNIQDLSVALIGRKDNLSTGVTWELYNDYPEGHPLHDPDEFYSPDYDPGELIFSVSRDPINDDQYLIYCDIMLIPPETQSTECLFAGATTVAWFDSSDMSAETIGRRTLFNEEVFYNPAFDHGKVIIESNDPAYAEFIGEFGFLEFTHYFESFTSYGGTTCTFNYYPELKEKYGQTGDVGMFVATKLEDEEVGI